MSHNMNYDQAVGAAIARFDLDDVGAQSFILALAHNDYDIVARHYQIDEDRAALFKSQLDLIQGGFA